MRKGRNDSKTLGIKPWLDLDINNNPLLIASPSSVAGGDRDQTNLHETKTGIDPRWKNGLAEDACRNLVAEDYGTKNSRGLASDAVGLTPP